MNLKDLIWKITAHDWVQKPLTPAARAILRYWPFRAGKAWLWSKFVRPFLAWRSRPFTARTRFGQRLSGNTRDVVQQCIYFFGVWEPAVTHWIGNRLRAGEAFIDIGANIGYFTLLASRAVGDSGKVVSIEASPSIFGSLKSHLELNHARNVRAVNLAVADKPGTLALYHGTDYNSGETTTVTSQGLGYYGEVDSLPLDAILTADELRLARLIKIDIEGGEWAVVKGIVPSLPQMSPLLEWVIEMHPALLAAQGRTGEDIVQLFGGAGYHAYHLQCYVSPVDCIGPLIPNSQPQRLRRMIDEEMVVIFSRVDAEAL